MKKFSLKFLCVAIFAIVCSVTTIATTTEGYDVEKTYDVIVCGAEPEGIAAAVSASRNGLKTVLIDKRNKPGGLYTSGMLSMLDLNYNDNGGIVNEGIFKEFYKVMGKGSFDIDSTTEYFRQLLANNNVDVLYNVTDIIPNVNQGKIENLSFDYSGRRIQVSADYVIDAMQEAPIARAAGADYVYGREELGINEVACATLVFSVKNADWEKVRVHLSNDQNSLTGANGDAAWGYPELLAYKPKTDATKFQLRGLNIAREKDGSLVINALQVFDVNALDEKSKQASYEAAKKELPYVIQYLKEKAVGFENAELDQVAEELYIREGVRIIGEERLTAEDSYQNKNFPNKIAYGSYAIDLQSTKKDNAGGNGLIRRNIYTIPMGAIIPKKLSNVLVVGKSASYDIIIHGSARTVPVGIAEGQAAAEMCYVAKKNQITFNTMYKTEKYYKEVQNNLISKGVTLNAKISTDNLERGSWSYAYIQRLRSQGLIAKNVGGMKTYDCDGLATYSTFSNIASLAYTFSNLDINILGKEIQNGPINQDKLIEIANKFAGTQFNTLDELYSEGVLDERTYTYVKATDKIYNNHAYAFMGCIIDYLRKETPMPTLESVTYNDVTGK